MPASGIPNIHEIPLGAHLCLFYGRLMEFLHLSASFLKAGLASHEFCVWIVPPPLTITVALDELSYHGLDGPALQATKQLQILSAHDWFSGDAFDVDGSLRQLAALPAMAHELGYASVRAVGGPGPFRSEETRQAFMDYERRATNVIAHLPFIGLCCYASIHCVHTDMMDIMGAHPRALVHTHAGWASV